MKLYQTPGGTWAGSEKDWKAAMKAEGADPKAMTRNTVDVPTSKAELMEFLTFNSVNVLNPREAVASEPAGGGETPPTPSSSAVPASPPAAEGNFQAQVDNLPLPYAAFIASRILERLRSHFTPAS